MVHSLYSKHFLVDVPARLSNTYELLTKIKSLPKYQMLNKMIISLDVVSLYTNVDIQETVSIVTDILASKFKDHIWKISIDSIIDILTYILKNNSFHYENKFYRQSRGLAMGSKMSPILVILAMN